MKTTYQIAANHTGTLEEVINAETGLPYTLSQVLTTMANLAFVVETVAHLQGRPELLAEADKARAMIRALPVEGAKPKPVTLAERLMPGCTCGATPESNACRCD